ncbi:hypothetical protein [Syntrophotalea acetylenica]|uniref:hypothetical protein n=1 Tax=Syntrophotalea acetylenica TaxID=29542 RepID=UPI002A35D445|nr:hypothetical protein [Syntrophotalea acetylenica]MDY0262712.1 hypothetical protein [Syntrophotalea acetylenica]
MTDYKIAAQMLDLPEKLIWRMHRQGIIANPLLDEELKGLMMISNIWRSTWFLRMALAGFSQARRKELFLKPELTRVERYILKCYLNAPKGTRLHTKGIIATVEHYLRVKVTPQQVKRVRSMAYEIRRGRRLDPDGG